MPRTLFEPVASVPVRSRRPLGTVLVSVVVHVAALGVIASLQLSAALDVPDVATRVFAYVPSPPPPPPPAAVPAPRPAAPRPNVMPSPVVDAAPTVVPDRVTPEPAVRPIPSSPMPPGMTGVGTFDPSLFVSASGTGPVVLGHPPRPPGPVRVGGDIQPPARTVYVMPSYPLFARTARIEGDVVLDATIDEKGVVANVTVRRSIPALDQAAIDAVSRWRYAPTRLNGVPVAVVMQVTVVFRMR